MKMDETSASRLPVETSRPAGSLENRTPESAQEFLWWSGAASIRGLHAVQIGILEQRFSSFDRRNQVKCQVTGTIGQTCVRSGSPIFALFRIRVGTLWARSLTKMKVVGDSIGPAPSSLISIRTAKPHAR
jgi:hypothetical protein